MRTLLKAAWVIGFDGRSHVVWRDAQVVFSGSRIEFVGRDFAGHVDRTVDYGQAVIGPGFIDLDALGDIDTGILTVDNGDKRENGRLWSEDYLREGPVDAFDQEEEVFKVRYAFAHLIRNGVTTALPISSMYYRAWAERYDEFVGIAAVAGELGLRVYLGPCCMTRHHCRAHRPLAGSALGRGARSVPTGRRDPLRWRIRRRARRAGTRHVCAGSHRNLHSGVA